MKEVSPKRFQHCLSTAETCLRLNGIFETGFDDRLCRATGLLHDLARDWNKEKLKDYVIAHSIQVEKEEWDNYKLLHAPVGGYLSRQMGFPEESQIAIRFHTLGSISMGPLGAILFAADYLEPHRTFLTDEQRQGYFRQDSLEAVCLMILDAQLEHFKTKGMKEAAITTVLHCYLREGGKL
ncbi:MAG: bis(5'-nucleosyl)-tetraphosphatase (symmetrical) YqeK [Spirochaetia bacterium]|nr:bis(5'-nucleosyl)-tetraphosphatase (symmetrical) YqeK [Spirochaetia bacterium]